MAGADSGLDPKQTERLAHIGTGLPLLLQFVHNKVLSRNSPPLQDFYVSGH